MVKERMQLFESFDVVELTRQINEFLTNLPDTHFMYVNTKFQEPHWNRAIVFYEATKSDEEMAIEAERRMSEIQGVIDSRIQTVDEKNKQVSDDELKKIVEENQKPAPHTDGNVWTIDESEKNKDG